MDALQLTRAALRSEALDAVIVPTADPYLSEYVAPCWALRAHLSGFEGSAGVLCVAADFAALSVDSRYWVQAEKTLVDGVELLRAERDPLKEATSRLLKSLSSGARVAIDPRLVSHEAFDGVSSVLAAAGIELLGCDVFEKHPEIWPERPSPVVSAVRPMKRPGVDARVKLAVLRQTLESEATDAVLLTSLDEIAWLTNLRGRDVPCNPVFGAVMLVRSDRAELFSESVRFDETARRALAASGIELREPEALGAALQALEGSTLLLDPRRTSHAYVRSTAHVCVRHGASPVAAMKSHKSPAELELIREAMLKDGIALAEFYAELEERLVAGERLTECDVVEMLHAWRTKDPEFLEESFETICAFGPNAALPHYQPHRGEDARIEGNGLLLIDSGAQYECGTTDITRMTAVGEPSAAMKADVALVTAGMLRLLGCRFPEGTKGSQIDAFARYDLWQAGCDFGHGTGHGVGYVLNVHEGPCGISPRASEPLGLGNVISDEPGLYRPGYWGVRVENLIAVVDGGTTPFGRFLRTEPLTCLPVDVRTLPKDFPMREALNRFNAACARRLRPHLSERARRWLSRAAKPL